MNKEDILQEIKQKPGMFIGAIIALVFATYYVLSHIGYSSINSKILKKQKKETTVLQPKPKINKKVKQKEKLIMATNPEARQAEIKKIKKKYNSPTNTVLKNKYNNSPINLSETIMKINKKKEKENKKIEQLSRQLKEQQRKLKEKNKEIEKIKKELEKKSKINYKRKQFVVKRKFLKPEVKKKIIEEALASDKDYNNFDPLYVSTTTTNNSTITNNNTNYKSSSQNIKTTTSVQQERFKIVPGSSFYGHLETPLYSDYTNLDAIVTIYNNNFKNCKFLGKVKYLKYKGMTIDIDKMSCNDGYVQSVKAKALRMSDLKPIFSDSVDRHILPKVVLGTLDTLINFQLINDSTTTTTNGTTIINTPTTLVDQMLKDEYERYKDDEEIANPQSLVVIFY